MMLRFLEIAFSDSSYRDFNQRFFPGFLASDDNLSPSDNTVFQ